MKPVNVHSEGNTAAPSHTAVTVRPLHEDEAHQERMRRLHNARASQRAARHHRVNRVV